MPELPEVETVRRVIGRQVSGKTVRSVDIRQPKVVENASPEEFSRAVVGRTVTGASRRGKFLTLELDDGDTIVIHLRMTGCLLFAPRDYPEEPHTHVVVSFDDGELRFSDTRRFGRFWLVRPGEDNPTGMSRLGPEPSDVGFTPEYLQERLRGKRRAVKDCIMDQSVIAGVGNIYADESLFKAGILPTRPACDLSENEWSRLADSIRERISFFTEMNAIPPEEYLETRGKDYRNTPYLQVYGHAGEPCPVCGTPMERTVVGGRGSVFCPRCQR